MPIGVKETDGARAIESLVCISAGVCWQQVTREAHLDGEALSRKTGSSPFLYAGPRTPGELPPMARVITVDAEDEPVAYPYMIPRESRAVNDSVDGECIIVLWQGSTTPALDESCIDAGRDLGSAGVFSGRLDGEDGERLTFRSEGDAILDEEAGSG